MVNHKTKTTSASDCFLYNAILRKIRHDTRCKYTVTQKKKKKQKRDVFQGQKKSRNKQKMSFTSCGHQFEVIKSASEKDYCNLVRCVKMSLWHQENRNLKTQYISEHTLISTFITPHYG